MTLAAVALTCRESWCQTAKYSADSRWLRIDRTSEMAAYVDHRRVERLGNQTVQLWTLWEFTSIQGDPSSGFNVVLARWQIDCANYQLRQMEAVAHRDTTFLAVLPLPADPQWIAPPPQSIGETLAVRGCLIAKGLPFDTVK